MSKKFRSTLHFLFLLEMGLIGLINLINPISPMSPIHCSATGKPVHDFYGAGFATFDDTEESVVIKMESINPDEKTDLATWLNVVEQLRHAPEWPEDELPIEMKQTHISVLLLSRNYVVKLKKPVDFGFLDYTTLNRRLRACENEIQLNRRLCSDTYIGLGGVINLDGQIRFSGKAGKIVDYFVWMKRLPEDRM